MRIMIRIGIMGRNATRSHFDLLSSTIYLFVINSCKIPPVLLYFPLPANFFGSKCVESQKSRESSANEIIGLRHDFLRKFRNNIRPNGNFQFFSWSWDLNSLLVSPYWIFLQCTHLFNQNRFTFHAISLQSSACGLFALAVLFHVIWNGMQFRAH